MTETTNTPRSGYIMLLVVFLLIAGSIAAFLLQMPLPGIGLLLIMLVLTPGFFYINPNGSIVLTLFGEYKGTVKSNGFFWVNPFYGKKAFSLRARNFDSERLKVNDKMGNPVIISVILVWRVEETFKAAFEVDDYESFVKVQTDAAVR